MTKETQFLGNLFPSNPVLMPIIGAVKEKYNLPELYPLDNQNRAGVAY